MKRTFLIITTCLLLAACNHQDGGAKTNAAEMAVPPPAMGAEKAPVTAADSKMANANSEPASGVVSDTEKKIIKEGEIGFETANIRQTRAAILASLKKAGGYVAEESEANNAELNRKDYVLKTCIPAKNFDLFLNNVSAIAVQIDSKNISSRDVTTQFIDMTTRLQNKKLLEARYQALLQKASRMADILEVEDKLTEIHSDIESDQGQLNYLNRQIAYSSLNITFYTKHIEPVDKGYSVGYKLKTALSEGWDMLGSLFFGLISIWPLALIIIVLFILFKKWRKRRNRAKA